MFIIMITLINPNHWSLWLISVHNNALLIGVFQLFPQIEEVMVQPLRESRDRYEELKQIDDAMNEVWPSEMLYFA